LPIVLNSYGLFLLTRLDNSKAKPYSNEMTTFLITKSKNYDQREAHSGCEASTKGGILG